MTDLALRIRILPHGEGLPLPSRQTPDSAGFDLAAAVPEDAPLVLQPGQRIAVPTGLAFAVPPGFEVQIRPRSGLALKEGVTVLNAPGTIDADYRGEVKVLLVHLGEAALTIARGMRIAQAVPAALAGVTLEVVTELDATARGTGGFGSTGA